MLYDENHHILQAYIATEAAGLTTLEAARLLQRRAKHYLRAGDYSRALACDQWANRLRLGINTVAEINDIGD